MALDLSLFSAQDIIRERHANQHDVIRIFAAPLSQLNQPDLEEARLLLLDSLYDAQLGSLAHGISYQHYHLPLIAISADIATARPLVEAWLRSALYMSYNLVLLLPEDEQPGELESLFRLCPDAIDHLCLRSRDQAGTHELFEAIAAYLPVQEPHLYVSLREDDAQLLEAMSCGFLGLSLHAREGLSDGKNCFLLGSTQPRTLSYQLIDMLEDPERDWEMLQQIASCGQTFARRELRG